MNLSNEGHRKEVHDAYVLVSELSIADQMVVRGVRPKGLR